MDVQSIVKELRLSVKCRPDRLGVEVTGGFVGDLLITTHAHTAVELPWTGSPDFDRGEYVRTLKKLSQLPCDHLFAGHGPAAIGCGKRVVEMAYTEALMKWR